MIEYLYWIIDSKNINANIFTLISVILSGMVSWIISAIYFSKGNRDNLRSSVLYPMRQVLEGPCSWEKYDIILNLQKEYSIKYLKKTERCIVNDLLKSYKEICKYEYEQVTAGILFDYFCDKLEKMGVDTKPVPVYIYEELVDVDYPENLTYINDDLVKILYKYPPELDEVKCKDAITKIFRAYAKECYGKEATVWFENISLVKVLNNSTKQSDWNKKFNEYTTAKKNFLTMKVFN